MNVLIVNGHQKWEKFSEGTLNKSIESFLTTSLTNHSLEVSRVDENYSIDIEVKKWKKADVIIYLFPIFWMSVPWKMKKYLEEVLMNSGGILFANDGRSKENPKGNYGTGGLSQGKSFMLIGTMNAPAESFGQGNFFNGDFDNLMGWLIKNNNFIGIDNQIPSVVFNDVVKNPNIEADLKKLEEVISLNLR